MKKRLFGISIVAAFVLLGVLSWLAGRAANPVVPAFDGERAYQDVAYQVSLGPRIPGSDAHAQTIKWIQDELHSAGWEVDIQDSVQMGHPVQNIVAHRGTGSPWTILGAHYDSRLWADHDSDPKKQREPVPGANDGASGAAVLVELGRSLPKNLNQQIWLVFFDAEDNGDIPGWDWLLGSRAFVSQLEGKPDRVVVIDMIGDRDLNIYRERNSNPEITDQVWAAAASDGYAAQFISSARYSMLDDHTPFLEAGIPAIDIIDFDYPYWHTTQDTTEKVSAQSLKAVGDTLRTWLLKD